MANLWLGLGRACAAALLLSFSVVWASGVLVSCLGALLLLGPMMVSAVLVELIPRRATPGMLWLSRRRVALLLLALYVFLFGAWMANVCLIDSALQKRTLIGYGISVLVALGSTALVQRLLRVPRWEGVLSSAKPSHLWLASCGVIGSTVSLLDTSFLPEGYWQFHVAMLGIGCVVYSLFSHHLISSNRRAHVACVLASAAVATLVVVTARGRAHEVYVAMSGNSTLQRRALLLARAAADRDGDGFSAVLEGGDCDDSDPKAYPLSVVGKDCLGWVDSRQRPPRLTMPALVMDRGPLLIVLVTVDALRCHDVVRGEHAFRDACADLTVLARAGRSREDAHTNFPSTAHAIGGLHSAVSFFRSHDPGRPLLADWMGAAGRYTQAISTHPNQLPQYIARSFRSADTALQAVAVRGSTTTSAQVTERTLRAVDDAIADQRKTFLWAHYYDPHAPYVAKPGSPWAISSNRERYLAEVRRVSTEVARLSAAIASRTNSAIMLITADHGEEFEEKAARNHGATLDEAATRIPMILWSPSQQWLPAAAGMPASLAEVAPFLASLVNGEPFASHDEAFFWTGSNARRIVGFYADGNKLTYSDGLNLVELFDLSQDPGELHNLAAERPELRQALGVRLARYLIVPTASHADADDD